MLFLLAGDWAGFERETGNQQVTWLEGRQQARIKQKPVEQAASQLKDDEEGEEEEEEEEEVVVVVA